MIFEVAYPTRPNSYQLVVAKNAKTTKSIGVPCLYDLKMVFINDLRTFIDEIDLFI